jgi:hypothetical protein
LAFFTQNKAKLCKNFDHNIGFWDFFAENCRKSQKIVITTSTPDTNFRAQNLKTILKKATSVWQDFKAVFRRKPRVE